MNSREALKDSAGDIRALEATIKANKAALTEAQKQAETAEATLKAFDGLNAKIAQWRAAEIRAKRIPGRLPQGLRDKQQARQAAQEELSLARETAQVIAADLIEDEKKLAQLKSAAMPAAAAVVHAEIVAPLAARLIELNKERHDLQAMVRAWMNLRVVDQAGWVRLGDQPDVAEALSEYHGTSEFIVSADPVAMQTARFKALVDALIADPSTTITAPALVVPKDFY